jgi:hypothetical protein
MDEFNGLKEEIIMYLKNTVDDIEIRLASATPDINIIQGDTGPVPPPSKTII